MGIKERREREKDAHRELVLSAAEEIIDKEGIDNLSIRGIAKNIEYSSAIIYHYFKDKDEIVGIIMRRRYQHIVNAVTLEQFTESSPEIRFRLSLKSYIDMALNISSAYETVLLSSSAEVMEHTSILFEGATEKRQALKMLLEGIKGINIDLGREDNELELTTQIVWTATFGLIIRLIKEKDISTKQKEALIERHINFMLQGIAQGSSKK